MLCKLTCNEITTATQRHLKVNGKRTLFLFKVLVMSTVRCAASLHPNAVTSEIETKVKYVNTCHPNGLCQAREWNTMSRQTCEADCPNEVVEKTRDEVGGPFKLLSPNTTRNIDINLNDLQRFHSIDKTKDEISEFHNTKSSFKSQ